MAVWESWDSNTMFRLAQLQSACCIASRSSIGQPAIPFWPCTYIKLLLYASVFSLLWLCITWSIVPVIAMATNSGSAHIISGISATVNPCNLPAVLAVSVNRSRAVRSDCLITNSWTLEAHSKDNMKLLRQTQGLWSNDVDDLRRSWWVADHSLLVFQLGNFYLQLKIAAHCITQFSWKCANKRTGWGKGQRHEWKENLGSSTLHILLIAFKVSCHFWINQVAAWNRQIGKVYSW